MCFFHCVGTDQEEYELRERMNREFGGTYNPYAEKVGKVVITKPRNGPVQKPLVFSDKWYENRDDKEN